MHFFNNNINDWSSAGFRSPILVFSVSFIIFCELVSAGLPPLNIQDGNSIKTVAGQVAHDLMGFYNGNDSGQTPGLLPQPYYQWETGGMLMTMMDYFYYTGDGTYNDLVTQGMLWQAGPNNDFMDANQTGVEGNDDQAFWGFAALNAAEQGFPNPPSTSPQWLQLADGVFNDQASRWDMATCNGGLRWQIVTTNNGYDYKSAIATGAFFNIAARLALYTGNDTYAQWAIKAYDWSANVGYLTSDYVVYDGAHVETNCTDIRKIQWTYNLGAYMHGAASMYSYTQSSDLWKQRVIGMVNGTSPFLENNVIFESSCEAYNTCADAYSFKSYFIRWLAATTKLCPFVHDQIMPILQTTAKAAAAQCTGGASGTMCGMKWTDNGTWDSTQGVGQEMDALEAIMAPSIDSCPSIDSQKSSPSTGPSASGSSIPSPSASGSSIPGPSASGSSIPGPSASGSSIPSPSSTGSGPPQQQNSSPAPIPTSQPITNLAVSCSTCSGGSTLISAPSAAISSIQNLASASGIAVAQSAAAQAVSAASTAMIPTATGGSAPSAAGSVGGSDNDVSASGVYPNTPTGTSGSGSDSGSGSNEVVSASTTTINGSQVVFSTTAYGTPTGEAGVASESSSGSTGSNVVDSGGGEESGSQESGQAASPESVFLGAAAGRRSELSGVLGWRVAAALALALGLSV